MKPVVVYLLATAAMTWFQLLFASLAHARGWTMPGMKVAFGNRDDLPPETPFVGRAKRAASNTVENLPLLALVMIAASIADAPAARVQLGIAVFFWARVAHWLIYLAGLPVVRTVAWFVSLGGLAIIGAASL